MTTARRGVIFFGCFAALIAGFAYLDHRREENDLRLAERYFADEEWLSKAVNLRCGTEPMDDPAATLGDFVAHTDCGADLKIALYAACSAERKRWLNLEATDSGGEYFGCLEANIGVDLPAFDPGRYPGLAMDKPLANLKEAAQ